MRRAALLCLVLLSCARRSPAPEERGARLPALLPPPPDEIAATVNGQPITLSQVAVQARAAGTSAQAALLALVRAELLAKAADEQGLAGDKEVQLRARQEMVRRLLQEHFEKETTPENTVTALEIKKSYERNQTRLVHPELRRVHHILLPTEAASPPIAALAEAVRRAALGATRLEDFDGLVAAFRDRAKEVRTDLRMEEVVTAEKGWTMDEFAKAAFALTQPGETSQVVQTSFGYHVIRLVGTIPAENVTLEEATPKIRVSLFPKAQARAFGRYLEQQYGKTKVAVFPEHLAAAKEAEEPARSDPRP